MSYQTPVFENNTPQAYDNDTLNGFAAETQDTSPLIITFAGRNTTNPSINSCDTSFADIKAAYDSGRIIVAKDANMDENICYTLSRAALGLFSFASIYDYANKQLAVYTIYDDEYVEYMASNLITSPRASYKNRLALLSGIRAYKGQIPLEETIPSGTICFVTEE